MRLEQINTQRRFVAGFSRQIDEGLLGKFEIAAEMALERSEAKLLSARAGLRQQLKELVESATIERR
jgi:hypothetical protein